MSSLREQLMHKSPSTKTKLVSSSPRAWPAPAANSVNAYQFLINTRYWLFSLAHQHAIINIILWKRKLKSHHNKDIASTSQMVRISRKNNLHIRRIHYLWSQSFVLALSTAVVCCCFYPWLLPWLLLLRSTTCIWLCVTDNRLLMQMRPRARLKTAVAHAWQ